MLANSNQKVQELQDDRIERRDCAHATKFCFT